jgi:hypothetical protein
MEIPLSATCSTPGQAADKLIAGRQPLFALSRAKRQLGMIRLFSKSWSMMFSKKGCRLFGIMLWQIAAKRSKPLAQNFPSGDPYDLSPQDSRRDRRRPGGADGR